MRTSALKSLLVAIISIATGAVLVNASLNKNGRAVPSPASSNPMEAAGSETISSTIPAPVSEIPAKKAPDEIKVSAAGAYLMTTNEPLYSFRNQKQWPIASVTKLMTALAVRKSIPGSEIITMTEDAVASFGEAGDFRSGERFKSEDLVRAMLVSSSNDAARALADHYGEEALVGKMNQLAANIGMADTTFVDAIGLSPRNLSTSDDLSRLVRFIWTEDPQIFAITRLKTSSIIDIDDGRSRKLVSTNFFAGRNDFLGGKTGQIPDSNGNLVSIFSLPDKSSPVVVVVLGAEDRFKETEKVLTKL